LHATQSGRQRDRAALREARQHDPLRRNPAFAFARDQRLDLRHALAHAGFVFASRQVETGDVVPRAHPHAGIDRHRAHRCVRKYKAQRGPAAPQQLRHQRREVVAVRAQAMQPQDGPGGRGAGLRLDAVEQGVFGHGSVADERGVTVTQPASMRRTHVAAGVFTASALRCMLESSTRPRSTLCPPVSHGSRFRSR
jgi:hypothetical protein